MEQDRARVNQTSAADESLTAPHFDEEVTLLRARPVVPLHEVKPQSRESRRLVPGWALVSMLVLGAVAATLVYTSRQPLDAPHNAAAIPDNSVSSSSGAGGAVINPAELSPTAVTEVRQFERQTDKVDSSVTRKPTTRVAVTATATARPREVEQDPAEDLELSELRLRRAERREARRLRREAEREARRKAQSEDDLLRIREIFEGAPRP